MARDQDRAKGFDLLCTAVLGPVQRGGNRVGDILILRGQVAFDGKGGPAQDNI